MLKNFFFFLYLSFLALFWALLPPNEQLLELWFGECEKQTKQSEEENIFLAIKVTHFISPERGQFNFSSPWD